MLFEILLIAVTVLLIGSILLQMQGSGLSSAFGGTSELFRSRQGMDKLLLGATIVLSILFGVLSIVLLVLR